MADSGKDECNGDDHGDEQHHHHHHHDGACCTGSHEAATGTSSDNTPDLASIQRALDLINLSAKEASSVKSLEDAKSKKFQFWETQPVVGFEEQVTSTQNEPIEANKPNNDIRPDHYSLPGDFVWSDVDLKDDDQLKELYSLLNENYVEDDDNMFRFDYSPEFLRWALQPPGWLPQWHCGVRVAKNNKLVGFISAIPCTIRVYDKLLKMVEINFLCVHKKLRAKRVAPVLIREITRRVNREGVFQAVYTAGVVLPRPVSTCRYWHRSLNPKKLVEVKFSHLGRNMTLHRMTKLYRLPNSPQTRGFRAMQRSDLPKTFKLLTMYLERFDMAPVFTEAEFKHWFSPQDNIIESYVVENANSITDFVSFYSLPSTIMHHASHKTLRAAYSFYNVAQGTDWVELMTDALIVAKNQQYDVFNALDLMDNKDFLEKLKFGIGDGNLQYYIYNWRCSSMEADKVGLVLQ